LNEHINDDRLDDLVAQLNIIENKLIDPILAFNYLQDWFISFLKNRALINSQNQTLVNIVKIREVSEYNGMIYVDGKELKISKDLSSQEVDTDMLPYKHELLRAYGDAENTTVKTESELNNIPEMYLMDYKEQRHNFLNAEYVRRSFREIFVDADANFDILKNELIKNLNKVRGPFENGYDKECKVLDRATLAPLDKSLLFKKTNLIGYDERLGLCHMLVNDGKLKWVEEHE
jgi:hypothetical protein